jgi:hypothetical protein
MHAAFFGRLGVVRLLLTQTHQVVDLLSNGQVRVADRLFLRHAHRHLLTSSHALAPTRPPTRTHT